VRRCSSSEACAATAKSTLQQREHSHLSLMSGLDPRLSIKNTRRFSVVAISQGRQQKKPWTFDPSRIIRVEGPNGAPYKIIHFIRHGHGTHNAAYEEGRRQQLTWKRGIKQMMAHPSLADGEFPRARQSKLSPACHPLFTFHPHH
jgi:hypothetical protein